jgi:hypothetical protein
MRWRLPSRSTSVDLDDQPLRQRVDDRHAHAVKAARHLVAAAPELAAGVQHRQRDLDAGLLVLRVDVDGDAAAVVDDAAAAVGEEGHVDARAVARHRLVDRVVDDLPDEVVEAVEARRPDVHAGPLADRFEAFEDLEILGLVGLSDLCHAASFRWRDRGVCERPARRKSAGQRPDSR